jgi:hypothetical protein
MTGDAKRRGPLDARTDPDRWEAAVRRITAAAAPELHTLARDTTPVLVITRWMRPVFAIAASIAALATAALVATNEATRSADTEDRPLSMADAITPEPIASWVLGGAWPTVEEVVFAIDEGVR